MWNTQRRQLNTASSCRQRRIRDELQCRIQHPIAIVHVFLLLCFILQLFIRVLHELHLCTCMLSCKNSCIPAVSFSLSNKIFSFFCSLYKLPHIHTSSNWITTVYFIISLWKLISFCLIYNLLFSPLLNHSIWARTVTRTTATARSQKAEH